MKRILLTALLALSAGLLKAQLVDVINEVYYQDDGTISAYPAGATTYRIYARFESVEDACVAVFSADGFPDLEVGASAPNAIWNTSFGGVTGPDLNAGFFAFVPELEYDSMVTIGRASSADPGNPVTAVSALETNGFDAAFGYESIFTDNLDIQDGTWFVTPDAINAYPVGDDNRVLLAQITTTASLYYQLNIQINENGVGGNVIQYSPDPDVLVGTGMATVFNPTLLYPSAFACADPEACNYDPEAEDTFPGACIYPTCSIPEACNYNPQSCGDQACTFPGCTNPASCNYDPAAGCDDGSCTPDAVWWIPETLSGGALFTCEQPVGYTLADPACFNVILSTNPNCLVDWDAACQAEYCTCTGACGCADATACNFNPQATFDDGSCILPDGCTNPAACNYDPAATCDDGTCDIVDSDQDGVLDCNDGCPLDANKTEPGICGCGTPDNDTDQDGLFDCEELELGTNPLLQDSDQDGLTDPLEVHVTQTNPLDPDTDGDGCDDASEIMFQCDDSPFNPDCPTDLNGDGAIDANDILDLIGTYGTFCDAP